MQKIGDKIVYNTIEEILEPSHTALVVWDVLRALTKIIFNKEQFSKNLNSIVELSSCVGTKSFCERGSRV